MATNDTPTLFLRLEGPLQAWGDGSRWVVRRTRCEPTRSGVTGLLCAALGRERNEPMDDLAALAMGVRIDRPGTLLSDYHTVGAGIGNMTAEGKIKKTQGTGMLETFVTQRHYLCDASFLVALQGPRDLIARVSDAVRNPCWPPFLGRKSCPPSTPLYAGDGAFPDMLSALNAPPWRARLAEVDTPPETLCGVMECAPDHPQAQAHPDLPLSFKPRQFAMRFVREIEISAPVGEPLGVRAPRIGRSRMSYTSAKWKARRLERSAHDDYRCVFCGVPSSPVHHITYDRANDERIDDLRSLCRVCHDAVTMLETERGMTRSRIDPLDPAYRRLIIGRRDDILRNRRRTPKARRRQP